MELELKVKTRKPRVSKTKIVEPIKHIWQQGDEVVIIKKSVLHNFNIGDEGVIRHINTANTANKHYQIVCDFYATGYYLEADVDFVLSKDYAGERTMKGAKQECILQRFINTMIYYGSSNSCGVKEIQSVNIAWVNAVIPNIPNEEVLSYLEANFVKRLKEKAGSNAYCMISMPIQSNPSLYYPQLA